MLCMDLASQKIGTYCWLQVTYLIWWILSPLLLNRVLPSWENFKQKKKKQKKRCVYRIVSAVSQDEILLAWVDLFFLFLWWGCAGAVLTPGYSPLETLSGYSAFFLGICEYWKIYCGRSPFLVWLWLPLSFPELSLQKKELREINSKGQKICILFARMGCLEDSSNSLWEIPWIKRDKEDREGMLLLVLQNASLEPLLPFLCINPTWKKA